MLRERRSGAPKKVNDFGELLERLLSENLLSHNIFCNYWYGQFEVQLKETTMFLSQKFANTRSTKALRDYFALAESQPTPATLPLGPDF